MRMTQAPNNLLALAAAGIIAANAFAQQTTEPVYRVANEAAANTMPAAAPAQAAPAPAPVAAAAPGTPFDLTQQPGEHPLAPTVRVLTETLNHIDTNVRDYTCTLVKQEALDGAQGEQQHIMMKVRNQPFSVYMVFLKPYQGREVLFVDGVNNNEMTVLETGWKRNLGKMNLDPNGMVAMRGQRHPVTQVGLRNLTARLLTAKQAEMAYGEVQVVTNPNSKIGSRPATMIQIVHPTERKEFATHIQRIFLDNELRVPIHYDAFLWPAAEGQTPPLDASYTYANLKLNVGLAARDFDATNPELFK
jgi:hypothetical protein